MQSPQRQDGRNKKKMSDQNPACKRKRKPQTSLKECFVQQIIPMST